MTKVASGGTYLELNIIDFNRTNVLWMAVVGCNPDIHKQPLTLADLELGSTHHNFPNMPHMAK